MRNKLADFVFWFHVFWVGLLVGGLAGVWWPWWRQAHLYLIIATITSQIVFMGCPLVVLEEKIRGHGNGGSFTAYCLERWCGTKINSWMVLGALIIIFFGSIWMQCLAS